MSFGFPILERKQFVVTCKRCRRDVPAGVGEFPFQPIVVPCPLCGELRRYERIIAELETYPNHLYARADADPWNLRHTQSTQPINCNQNPCMLPKPPELKYVALNDIPAKSSTSVIT
jgi:hypothetical protein